MWFIQVETPGVELKLLEVFHLGIYFLQTPDCYNPIRIGSGRQGALFYLCNPANNPIEMCYETSCMINLSVVNLDNTCKAFFVVYISMKVPLGEAYQSTMFNNASIAA